MKPSPIIDNKKYCNNCGSFKEMNNENFYYSKGRLKVPCKECLYKTREQNGDKANIANLKYRKNNKEKILEYSRTYYRENKEEIAIYNKYYRDTHKEELKIKRKICYQQNKQESSVYNKEYRNKNKEKINKKRNENESKKRKFNPVFKIKKIISDAIRKAIKSSGNQKNGSIWNYLGYTIIELKTHLESQFDWWMSWKNHGVYSPKTWDNSNFLTWTWQIDYIIPRSLFKYTSMEDEEFKRCWSLSNLRPLDAKSNNIDGVNKLRHFIGK